jgi:hypothetical protein
MIFILITKNDDLSFLLSYNSGLIGRILLSQISGIYHYFEYFPTYEQHIGFSSLSQLFSNAFNIEYVERASRKIMILVNPLSVEKGEAGVMNTLFLGEAWANFGLIGLLLCPLYLGILIQIMYMYFLKNRKNPINIGLFTYFSYRSSLSGGFNDYIYNPFIIIIVFLFISIYVFAYILKEIQINTKRNR